MKLFFIVYSSSTLKFVLGPILGSQGQLHWLATIVLTILGSTTGVLIGIFFGKYIKRIFFFYYKRRSLFTTRNRKIIQVWRKFGIAGIAFLIPIILTPIGGGLLIASLVGRGINKYFRYVLFWNSFWASIITPIAYLFPSFI